jgi:hypothetical protein
MSYNAVPSDQPREDVSLSVGLGAYLKLLV